MRKEILGPGKIAVGSKKVMGTPPLPLLKQARHNGFEVSPLSLVYWQPA